MAKRSNSFIDICLGQQQQWRRLQEDAASAPDEQAVACGIAATFRTLLGLPCAALDTSQLVCVGCEHNKYSERGAVRSRHLTGGQCCSGLAGVGNVWPARKLSTCARADWRTV